MSATPSTPAPRADSGPSDARAPLPVVTTSLSPEAILDRLDLLARRGKLAGYTPGSGHHLFSVTDFGRPFESRLVALAAVSPSGTRLTFELRLKRLMPWVFGVALVLSVWPGVWLTDSLLRTYFQGYSIPTWWWYLPLTVPFCPLAMISAVRKSRADGHREAGTIVQTIRAALGGAAEPAE